MRDRQQKKSDDARQPVTKQVTTNVGDGPKKVPDPCDLLFSSDLDGDSVKQVIVTDKGSKSGCSGSPS